MSATGAPCITGALLLACLAGSAGAQDAQPAARHPLGHEFYFTRGVYSSSVDNDPWGPRWAIDYPEADQHFLVALARLTGIDAYATHNAQPLGGRSLREFPFVYVVEAGALQLSGDERTALREYLLAGGFMMVDDFWGTWAWDNLVAQLELVLPGHPIRDVPLDHPLFHSFYDIDELLQVPNVALAGTGRTHEYDGHVPHARGIFDARGRLMVLINWNTDLGDAWEWADDADYPLHFSSYAYKLGINIVIYAISY